MCCNMKYCCSNPLQEKVTGMSNVEINLHWFRCSIFSCTKGQKPSHRTLFYSNKTCVTNPNLQIIDHPIHIEYKFLQHVVMSTAILKTGGFFYNYQTTIALCHMLQALGHPQPKTPVKIDTNNNHHIYKSNSVMYDCMSSPVSTVLIP